MSKLLFEKFNSLYFDFLNFLKTYSNGDKMFHSFYKKNYVIKNTNIKLLIKGWYEHITIKYYHSILEENINFFLNKNYDQDLKQVDIIKCINFFKENYNTFEKKIVDKFVGYLKQLTNLSYMYFNAKDI